MSKQVVGFCLTIAGAFVVLIAEAGPVAPAPPVLSPFNPTPQVAPGFTTQEASGPGSVAAAHGQRTGGGNMIVSKTGVTEQSCFHLGQGDTHVSTGIWGCSGSARMGVLANANADGECTVKIEMIAAIRCDGGALMIDTRTASVMAVWVNNGNPVRVVGPDGIVLVDNTVPVAGGITFTTMHVVLADQDQLSCTFQFNSLFATSANVDIDWSGIGAAAIVGQTGEVDGELLVSNIHVCQ